MQWVMIFGSKKKVGPMVRRLPGFDDFKPVAIMSEEREENVEILDHVPVKLATRKASYSGARSERNAAVPLAGDIMRDLTDDGDASSTVRPLRPPRRALPCNRGGDHGLIWGGSRPQCHLPKLMGAIRNWLQSTFNLRRWWIPVSRSVRRERLTLFSWIERAHPCARQQALSCVMRRMDGGMG
jgi:hypothetical protein